MKVSKVNEYSCTNPDCGGKIITIDLHEGTTPFMMQCSRCNKAMATSAFYQCKQNQDADIAYIKPTTGPHVTSEHVLQGGLIPVDCGNPIFDFELQKQPNSAACLINSFAIVLGVPVIELIQQVGHDGEWVMFPTLQPPYRFAGHHIQEMIFMCFERGYTVTEFQPILLSESFDQQQTINNEKCFEKAVTMRPGVLVGRLNGRPHAVAWDQKQCYDGSSMTIFSIEDFEIRTFYAISPMAKSNPNLHKK